MNQDDINEQGRIQITPTLVVGIGGTGTSVVRNVKGALQRFFEYRNLGSIPPVLRFLALDSVANAHRSGQVNLADSEYVFMGDVDGDSLVTNAGHFLPELKTWWDYKRAAPGHIDDGCGQMRDVGRLVFYARYKAFRDTMNGQLNGLRQRDSLSITRQRGFVVRPGQIHICVVCSIAGGTGSGMFLDVAYNLRDAVQRYSGITPSLVGYLVTPDVYVPKQDSVAEVEAIQANGFAALAELEYLNRHPEEAQKFFHSYPLGTTIQTHGRPFDHTFLVGIRDQQGQGLSSPDDVFDLISQKIFLEAVYLDQTLQERDANKFADRDSGGALGDTSIGRYYSAFTASTVSIRRDIALDYCEHRLSLDVVGHLRQPFRGDAESLPAIPTDINADTYMTSFAQMIESQNPFPVPVDSKAVDSGPLVDVLDGNDQTYTTWLAAVQRPLQEATRARRRELQEYIHKQVWDLALNQGIDAVFTYLRNWQTLLQHTANELNTVATQQGAEADAKHRAYEHDRAELEDMGLGPSLGGILTFRDSTAKRRHHRERLFDSAQAELKAYARARFEQAIAQQTDNVIVHSLLGDTMHDERGSISRLLFQWEEIKTTLAVVQRDLQASLKDLETDVDAGAHDWGGYEVARELMLSNEQLNDLFAQIVDVFDTGQFVRRIAEVIETNIDDDKATVTPPTVAEGLRKNALQIAHDMCLPLFAATGVQADDDRLKAASEKVRLALSHCMGEYLEYPGVLDDMFRYNAAFWNYFEGAQAGDYLERTNLVAVESKNPPGWPREHPDDLLARGNQGDTLPTEMQLEDLVETGDPSLLGVYRASYGLPLFLVNELGALRQAYYGRRERNVVARDDAEGMAMHIAAPWNDQIPCDPTLDLEGNPVLANR